MKKITVWQKQESKKDEEGKVDKVFVLNHIEDGWVEEEQPKPKHPDFILQHSWKNFTWNRIHAFLDNGKVVYSDSIERI